MNRIFGSWAIGALMLGMTSSAASGQHVHSVPHTTTHYDTVRHGGHYHNVPHTTTHFDNVVHYGPDYIPHTTTHVDAVRHNGHVDYVPHTTTHLHPTYPGSGVLLNPGERIISSTPVIPSSPMVITQPPPATLSSSSIAVPGQSRWRDPIGRRTIAEREGQLRDPFFPR